MEWKDVLGVVTKLAPTIAAGIGGPLAGGAIEALEGVFGLTTSGTTDDKQNALVAAISGASADQLLALKKADQDYQSKMTELGFKNAEALAALQVSDLDSARKREVSVKDNTPKVLAYAITLLFASVLGFMLFANVPAGSRDLLNIMLGMLGTSYVSVISYYFGSTAGSLAKSELLAGNKPSAQK
jgi:hypothetical protein